MFKTNIHYKQNRQTDQGLPISLLMKYNSFFKLENFAVAILLSDSRNTGLSSS